MENPRDERARAVEGRGVPGEVEAPPSGPPVCAEDHIALPKAAAPVLGVLGALSFAHLLNDTLQSLIPAIYPILKTELNLDFRHIGLITLTNQLTASLLQPFVGLFTDKHPQPYSLAIGMTFTLVGLVLLSLGSTLTLVLLAVGLVGIGSSVFHPEASRVAHLSSGGQHGFAQSLFQVGGNAGSSLGPLLAALIVVSRGQGAIIWFTLLALTGILVLSGVGRWYRRRLDESRREGRKLGSHLLRATPLARRRVFFSLGVLVVLVFSKYFYLASMGSYYTFFLMEKFGLSVKSAQLHLFIFLAAIAAGTFLGGPIGDRIGRKAVIWASILGVTPFALALPYANLFWCGCAQRDHRRDLVVCFLGHPGLCAGTGSRKSRPDERALLWPRLRHGRNRLSRARGAGGSPRDSLRLPCLFLSATDRAADGVSAES